MNAMTSATLTQVLGYEAEFEHGPADHRKIVTKSFAADLNEIQLQEAVNASLGTLAAQAKRNRWPEPRFVGLSQKN